MPDLFPTTPKPKEISLHSDQPDITTFSQSGKRQTRISAGHLWRAKVDYPVMLEAAFRGVYAFFSGQRGAAFDIEIAPYNNAVGTVSGTPTGTGTKGNLTVTASGSGTVKAGDCFKFASHTKVYMNKTDKTLPATLTLTSPLIESVSGSGMTFNGLKFRMAIDGEINKLKVTRPNRAAYSVDLVESIL